MPWTACGAALAGAAGYLPCAAWLWPDDDGEQHEPMLQPPIQTLDECLIPPAQPDLYARLPDQQGNAQARPGGSWDSSALQQPSRSGSVDSGRAKPTRIRSKRLAQASPTQPTDEIGGIELKEAGSNLLLGQFHRDQGGQFVKPQLGRQKPQRESTTRDGDSEAELNPRTPDLQQELRSPVQNSQRQERLSR